MSSETEQIVFSPAVHGLIVSTLGLLKPPPRLMVSQWAETYFRLPERSSAQPGRFRLWPYQRAWLDTIGEPKVRRVTLIKSARIGWTKCLMAIIGNYAANNPCSIILLVPTDDDARGYAVDEIEPSFAETPVLSALIQRGRLDGRNTLTKKSFLGGGSLKILAARAPRNLRRHDAKVLLIDEADGMEITVEGDAIKLAEMRTVAHPDRKILVGSTPTIEGISVVDRLYAESDQRVFEVPCPNCGVFKELLWSDIRWPDQEPEKAAFLCQSCDSLIDERHKLDMVTKGAWRVTRPEITDHAGFRINAMVSLLANARWGELAKEFLKAKRSGPSDMQVFCNTVEGRVWKQSVDSIDETTLIARAEPFGLDKIPVEVLALTAGIDTQNDRLEITIVGWSQTSPFVLGHHVIFGSTLDESTWDELDELLRTKWRHPNGWQLGIDAAAVDSGGTGTGPESRTQKVYDFCSTRLPRRIYAIKGVGGPRAAWQPTKSKTARVRLFIVGVDQIKTEVMERLAALPFVTASGDPVSESVEGGSRNPQSLRVSDQLPEEWFTQVTSERRFVKYVRNRAVIEFRMTRAGLRNEGLDCTVYAFAARLGVRPDFAERASRASETPLKRRSMSDLAKGLSNQ